MAKNAKYSGLYEPQYERGSCGIGAVVNISGRRDHSIIEYGKEILLNLRHRGAAGADEVQATVLAFCFKFLMSSCRMSVNAWAFPYPVRVNTGWEWYLAHRIKSSAGNATKS